MLGFVINPILIFKFDPLVTGTVNPLVIKILLPEIWHVIRKVIELKFTEQVERGF